MMDKVQDYTRRRNELFDILDKAIIDAIVEREIKFEPVDMSKQFDKYKGSLIAAPKVGTVKIDVKKEHS